MDDSTIMIGSPVGERLEVMGESKSATYLKFNNKKIELVAKITIGRSSDNNIVVNNKLASRHHATIQKIKNSFFIKDEDSSNGTFVNGVKIPRGKYVKLTKGSKISIGNDVLVID